MLKKILFASLVLATVISSCSKDDEKSFGEKVDGQWNIIEFDYVNCTDPMDDETFTISTDCTNSECQLFKFDENGTIIIETYEQGQLEESDSGTWRGDEESLTLCIDGECETGSVEFDGDRMVMTFPMAEDGCDIILTFVR